ncbi:hypothetical protein [Streptomyces sp. NPDC093970]|uniref:hypothetical protein n=1 Tax=Streptomyces sp. NPDC093970 TaxID=3155076 RepID=UPI00344AC8B9
MFIFVVSAGVPVALLLGTATGWIGSATGAPAWTSWTVAVLAACAGFPLAFFCTPPGTRSATGLLLGIYRREGLETAEREYLSRLSPYRAGLQLHNLGLALERAGEEDGALAVYRRAAEHGYPQAMARFARLLSIRGEEDEARAWFHRATQAGYRVDEKRAVEGE